MIVYGNYMEELINFLHVYGTLTF